MLTENNNNSEAVAPPATRADTADPNQGSSASAAVRLAPARERVTPANIATVKMDLHGTALEAQIHNMTDNHTGHIAHTQYFYAGQEMLFRRNKHPNVGRSTITSSDHHSRYSSGRLSVP